MDSTGGDTLHTGDMDAKCCLPGWSHAWRGQNITMLQNVLAREH